jgi:Secretion system C-terminal sorting domain
MEMLEFFLYGGIENSTTLGTNFYNNDINTNSINNDNTSILGINQKSLFGDVDYAYIVGECTNCFALQGTISGDGIVRSVNANLNNFYTLPLPVNEFIYTAEANNGFIGLHSDLPHAVIPNMQGLDEPNEYNFAYGIYANTIYIGFITQQPTAGYLYDFDDYKFTVNATGLVNVSINNTYSANLTCRIMNSSFAQVATTTLTGNSSGGLSQALNPGQYYLEFFSTASSTSYNFPYTFSVTGTLETNNIVNLNDIIYPNPASSIVFVQSENTFDTIEIYNLFGQKVISTNEYIYGINVSDLAAGNYIIKLYNKGNVITQKLIKQ